MHPLITTQVQLSFDAETGSILVEPEALVPHHMDIELLQGLKLDGFDLLLDVREGFRDAPVGPFDPENRILYEQAAHSAQPGWQHRRRRDACHSGR